MKINNILKFKREIKDLRPENDWYIIVALTIIIFIVIVIYSIYSYLFIQRQIDIIHNDNSILTNTATSTNENLDENKLLKDINNMNTVLKDMQIKEQKYNEIIENTSYIETIATTTKQ